MSRFNNQVVMQPSRQGSSLLLPNLGSNSSVTIQVRGDAMLINFRSPFVDQAGKGNVRALRDKKLLNSIPLLLSLLFPT